MESREGSWSITTDIILAIRLLLPIRTPVFQEDNLLEEKTNSDLLLDRRYLSYPGITAIMNMRVAEFYANPAAHEVLFVRAQKLRLEMATIQERLHSLIHFPIKSIILLKGDTPQKMADAIKKKSDIRNFPFMWLMRDIVRSRFNTLTGENVGTVIDTLYNIGTEFNFDVTKIGPRREMRIIDPQTNKPIPGMYGYSRSHMVVEFKRQNRLFNTDCFPFEIQAGTEKIETIYQEEKIPIADQLMPKNEEVHKNQHDFCYKASPVYRANTKELPDALSHMLEEFEHDADLVLAKAGKFGDEWDEGPDFYQINQQAGRLLLMQPKILILGQRLKPIVCHLPEASAVEVFRTIIRTKYHGDILPIDYHHNLVAVTTEAALKLVLLEEKKSLYLSGDSINNMKLMVHIDENAVCQFTFSGLLGTVLDNFDCRDPLSDVFREKIEIMRLEWASFLKKIKAVEEKGKKITPQFLINLCFEKKYSNIKCSHSFEQSFERDHLPVYHITDDTIYFEMHWRDHPFFDRNGVRVPDAKVHDTQMDYLKTSLAILCRKHPGKVVELILETRDKDERVKQIEKYISALNHTVRTQMGTEKSFYTAQIARFENALEEIQGMIDRGEHFEKAIQAKDALCALIEKMKQALLMDKSVVTSRAGTPKGGLFNPFSKNESPQICITDGAPATRPLVLRTGLGTCSDTGT